eukprot:4633510-Pyramimonas_sp.AAC.1
MSRRAMAIPNDPHHVDGFFFVVFVRAFRAPRRPAYYLLLRTTRCFCNLHRRVGPAMAMKNTPSDNLHHFLWPILRAPAKAEVDTYEEEGGDG